MLCSVFFFGFSLSPAFSLGPSLLASYILIFKLLPLGSMSLYVLTMDASPSLADSPPFLELSVASSDEFMMYIPLLSMSSLLWALKSYFFLFWSTVVFVFWEMIDGSFFYFVVVATCTFYAYAPCGFLKLLKFKFPLVTTCFFEIVGRTSSLGGFASFFYEAS